MHKIKTSRTVRNSIYFFCIFIFGMLLYLTFQEQTQPGLWGRWINALHTANVRLVWVIAVFGVFVPTMFKKDGFFRKMFVNPFWKPLARLTFSFYMLHFMVILLRNYSMLKSPYIGQYQIF